MTKALQLGVSIFYILLYCDLVRFAGRQVNSKLWRARKVDVGANTRIVGRVCARVGKKGITLLGEKWQQLQQKQPVIFQK